MNEQFIKNYQASGGGEVASFGYAPQSTELSAEAAAVSAALAGFGEDAGFFCVCFPGAAEPLSKSRRLTPS